MKQLLSKFLLIKIVLYLIGFSVLAYGIFYRTQTPHSSEKNISSYMSWVNQVCIWSHCFDIEVADNDLLRQQWLMYRQNLPSQSGMLFVFDQDRKYPFWMKNTLIPLDIIWINRENKIVDIKTVQPCTSDPCPTYEPSADALYVLEINAGLSQLLTIESWAITQFKKK